MNRRKFIKGTMLAGAGLALPVLAGIPVAKPLATDLDGLVLSFSFRDSFNKTWIMGYVYPHYVEKWIRNPAYNASKYWWFVQRDKDYGYLNQRAGFSHLQKGAKLHRTQHLVYITCPEQLRSTLPFRDISDSTEHIPALLEANDSIIWPWIPA